MEAFQSLDTLGEAVVIALSGTLILFFIISPLAGFVMARQVAKQSTLVLVIGVMVAIADLTFTGIVYVGRATIAPADLSDFALYGIGIAVGFIVAWPVGRYLAWVIADAPRYDPSGELRHLQNPDVSLMPAQRKRIERLQKRR